MINILMVTAMLASAPSIDKAIIQPVKIEARRRGGKGKRDRRRGGSGLR
jgi:hypothetical protein